MKGAITVERRHHVEVHFGILSHLDLGRDAANLYNANRAPRKWTKRLLGAYKAAPSRLVLHALPLVVPDAKAELELLRSNRWWKGGNDADRRLGHLFAEILDEEMSRYPVRSEGECSPSWLAELSDCRSALYERRDAEPPPLLLVDAPSLATSAGWTHGRGTVDTTGRHVVAVALDVGESALIQTLHEEIHPVTDPVVLRRNLSSKRDTRVESKGYEIHRALERRAVEVGTDIVAKAAPEYAALYEQWRRRFQL